MSDSQPLRRQRLLEAALRCYPLSWRQGRQAELVWMIDQERTAGRPVSGTALIDVAGHGLEARLETWLRFMPRAFRGRVAVLATSAAAAVSLLLLVLFESSSPTLGAVVFAGFLLASGLTATGHGGLARLASVVSTLSVTAVPVLSAATGLARPPLFILGPLFLLGLLSCLATTRLSRRHRTRLLAVTTVAVAMLVVQVIAWSVYANRVFDVPRYRGGDDRSLLAVALQGSVLVALVAVTCWRAWRVWLPALSLTATLLLLYYDPDQPVLALGVAVVCWLTTTTVNAVQNASILAKNPGLELDRNRH